MEKVISGNINEIGHNSKNELVVAFKNESIYVYKEVLKNVYEELKVAPSAGSFMHRNIKGNHSFDSIDTKINLCDSCVLEYPTCDPECVFGNGIGNDNICHCDKYKKVEKA